MNTGRLLVFAVIFLAAFTCSLLLFRVVATLRSSEEGSVGFTEAGRSTTILSEKSEPRHDPSNASGVTFAELDWSSAEIAGLRETVNEGIGAFFEESPERYVRWLESMGLTPHQSILGPKAQDIWTSQIAAIRSVQLDFDRAVVLQFAHLRWSASDVPKELVPGELRTSVRIYSRRLTSDDGNLVTPDSAVISVFVPGKLRITGLDPQVMLVLDERPVSDVEAYLILEFIRDNRDAPWQLVATGVFGGPFPQFASPPPPW
jgi:hypothetical protein